MINEKEATRIFDGILGNLELPAEDYSEENKQGAETRTRLVGAIMTGRLEYDENTGVFTQKLISPFKFGDEKTISELKIEEPTGVQMRATAKVQKKNDDIGKGMAILGEVTGLGIAAMNEMKARDMMVSVEVIGLFL